MFIFIALPVFLVVVILSLWLASRSGKLITEELTAKDKNRMKTIGFISAVTLTFFSVWTVPLARKEGYADFILLFGIVILLPLALGLILSVVNWSNSQKLTAAAVGAFLAAAPTPIIVPLGSLGYIIVAGHVEFQLKCQRATISIFQKVGQATGVAFVSDSFTEPPTQTALAFTKPQAIRLLNQSLVEYIERPSTEISGLKGKSKFERISIRGDKKNIYDMNEIAANYVYEPIDNITADFLVKSVPLSGHGEHSNDLGGSLIEIYRRQDNSLVSRAEYYWSDNTRSSCPWQARTGEFILSFISESLSVRDPSGHIPKLPME